MKVSEVLSGMNPNNSIVKKANKNPTNNLFANLIEEVKKSQFESKKLTEDFINGRGVEIHEVMIAGEKAKTNLQLLMEIRNKALDMYKELTRIQM